jgi:2TM domain
VREGRNFRLSTTLNAKYMSDEYFPPNTPEREIAIRRRVHRLAEFYRHALVFVVFIGCLWALNAWQIYASYYSFGSTRWYSWWAMWPTLGWGIGLLTHAITALPRWTFFSQDWEDRKVKELMEREQL